MAYRHGGRYVETWVKGKRASSEDLPMARHRRARRGVGVRGWRASLPPFPLSLAAAEISLKPLSRISPVAAIFLT
jgi:hypothetical protein